MIVVEVTRPSPATTPQQLANIAKTAIACRADALCVRLDSEDTPEGNADLFAVVQVGWGGGGIVTVVRKVTDSILLHSCVWFVGVDLVG